MISFQRIFLIGASSAVIGCAAPEQKHELADSVMRPAASDLAKRPVVSTDSQPPSQGTATVQVFFIALEGATQAEKVGCGDGMLPISVDAKGIKAPLRFALEQLLAGNTKLADANAYNALSRMKLTIDSIAMRTDTAIIGLRGHFTYGGVCDAPRINAQLTRTATQFSTVRAASFFVNGRPLSELLSEQ